MDDDGNTTERRKYEGDETLAIIYNAVFHNSTNIEIAAVLRISSAQWYDWKKTIPEILETIKRAESDAREAIRKQARVSLLKKVQGYSVEEERTTFTVDKDGAPSVKEVLKNTKHIAPDSMLIMYALNNLDQDNYANRQKIDLNVEETDFEPTTPEQEELLRKLNESVNGEVQAS